MLGCGVDRAAGSEAALDLAARTTARAQWCLSGFDYQLGMYMPAAKRRVLLVGVVHIRRGGECDRRT
jgi:hypothetical protein